MESINNAQDRANKAMQAGNMEEMEAELQLISCLRVLLNSLPEDAAVKIFWKINGLEHINDWFDLHCQTAYMAKTIVTERIRDIKKGINTGDIMPNHDQFNHVLSIITGRGNHSANNQPVIKPLVDQILKEEGLEYKMGPCQGYFLVRFRK